VIIRNLDLVGVSTFPDEANPVLVIDPDTVLAGAVSLQGLKPIAWEHSQVGQLPRGCQLFQLSLRHPRDALKPPCVSAVEQIPGFLATKGFDHPEDSITRGVTCRAV
jgi:hypothetical protein